MDRRDALRRLADVVNLADRVAHAEKVVAASTAKIDKAQARLADAEAARAKADDALDALDERLSTARQRAAEIPPEMVAGLAEELGARRAARGRYLAALTAGGPDDAHVAAVAAAAAEAGVQVVAAKAEVASGTGKANGKKGA